MLLCRGMMSECNVLLPLFFVVWMIHVYPNMCYSHDGNIRMIQVSTPQQSHVSSSVNVNFMAMAYVTTTTSLLRMMPQRTMDNGSRILSLQKYQSKGRRWNPIPTVHSNSRNDNNDSSECDSDECLLDAMEQETDPIRKQQLRMSIVRSIQNSFYASPSSTTTTTSTSTSTTPSSTIDTSANAYNSIPSTSTSITSYNNDFDDAIIPNLHPKMQPTWENGGTLEQLCLWRVPWIELIGRTNVLFVHDAIYTNMFETLIRRHQQQPQPQQTEPILLFGHVYQPLVRAGQRPNKIPSWKDDAIRRPSSSHTNHGIDDTTVPSLIGTLMKINDYRRMNDGKLILYVQGIERFLITHVQQTIPYGIVNVQLLPDLEELDPNSNAYDTAATISKIQTVMDDVIRPLRNQAIVDESWNKWFPYEYSNRIGLPIPPSSSSSSSSSLDTNNQAIIPSTMLSMSDIVGCALAKVVPFAPLDPQLFPTTSVVSELPPPMLDMTDNNTLSPDETNVFRESSTLRPGIPNTERPIEEKLLQMGIFIRDVDDDADNDAIHPSTSSNQDSMDELEQRLWITLNSYYMKSNTAISPFLLSMLPPSGTVTWPKGFLLEGIANVMERTSKITSRTSTIQRNKNLTDDTISEVNTNRQSTTKTTVPVTTEFHRVPVTYPSWRRQKRCSYYIAQILESFDIDNVPRLRQTLLRIPSTKQRLSYVLGILENEVNNLTNVR